MALLLSFFFVVPFIVHSDIVHASNQDIVFGTTITGSITSTNTNDTYKIVVPKAGTININMTSQIDAVNAELEDSNGNRIRYSYLTNGSYQNPATWSESVDLEPGTYYLTIVPPTQLNIGKFNLEVKFTSANNNDVEPNNGTVTSQALTLNTSPITGFISWNDDTDVYKMVVPKAGTININMTSQINYLNAYLKDSNGNQIDYKSLNNGSFQSPATWSESFDLEPGTYYLSVSKCTGFSNNTGTYNLGVKFTAANNNDVEPNNGTVTAQTLTLNANPTTGFISWNDDTDVYKIVVPKAGNVYINMTSQINYLNAYLKDSNGNQIDYKSLNNGSSQSPATWSESVDLEPGTYYITVSRSSGYTGTYNLGVKFTAANNNDVEPNNGTVTAQTLTLNANPTTGFISWNDDTDVYKIVVPKAGNVYINMTSQINYLNAYLKDSNGNQIDYKSLNNGSFQSPATWSESVDLEPGTYYITVSRGGYTGKYTICASEFGQPVVAKFEPSNYNSIRLSWGKVDEAQGYQIYRATSSTGTYTLIKSTTDISYVDTGLVTGTTYYYKIRSFITSGTTNLYGAYSGVVSGKPIPANPANTLAVLLSSSSSNIRWSTVSGATGYEVWRSTSSTGTYSLVSTTAITNYTNTGLTSGTTYYYKVRAYTLVGTTKVYGNYSSIVSGKLGSIVATSASFDSSKLSWTGVTGAAGYEIYRSTSASGTYSLITSTTGANYTDTGITTGITYYYKIRSYTMSGTTKVYGAYSGIASVKPIPATPANTIAVLLSSSSSNISWGTVSGATGYEVWRSTSSTGTYSLVSTTAITNYTNTGLTSGTTYYYKVRAYTLVGTTKVYGNYSSIVSGKLGSIVATSASFDSSKLSWTGVTGAAGYEIYRSTSASGTYSLITSTTGASYTDAGLTTGTTYYYKIRSYTMSGTTKVYGSYSGIASVKPIPATPSGITITKTSSTSIKTSWSSVNGATGYEVYRSDSLTGTYVNITTSSNLYYDNTSLAAGKTYYYKVRSYKLVGTTKVYSNWSGVVNLTL